MIFVDHDCVEVVVHFVDHDGLEVVVRFYDICGFVDHHY
jgi:hypothetical protein